MMRTKLFVLLGVLLLVPTVAHANTHRTFTLILDFNTCTANSTGTVFDCVELDGTGKPVGTIHITINSIINSDGTCAANPLCSFTDNATYVYTLDGGTMTVGSATEWQGLTSVTDANGNRAYVGFSVGAITSGTGKYEDANGTLTMRWDINTCICLFELVEA
jgi:hypothetical protein